MNISYESKQSRVDLTAAVTRGVRRALALRDVATVTEFAPARGLRADVFGVGPDGEIWIIEVKSSVPDFRADQKWVGYGEWCDLFFFAVPQDFPRDELPDGIGVITADAFGAEIVREANREPLAPARRKALTKSFARQAARRLHRVEDPDFDPLAVGEN